MLIAGQKTAQHGSIIPPNIDVLQLEEVTRHDHSTRIQLKKNEEESKKKGKVNTVILFNELFRVAMLEQRHRRGEISTSQ